MTDEIFDEAAEIKGKIKQIDAALQLTPPRAPYTLNSQFPADMPFLQQLAAPGLNQANEEWPLILKQERAKLVEQFAALGNGHGQEPEIQ